MGGPSDSLILLNNGTSLTNFPTLTATPTFCDSLAAAPLALNGSSFTVVSPTDTRPASPGLLSFFRPTAAAGDARPLPPDLLETSSADLTRIAREGYDEDVRADVRQLLNDFPACAVHNLSLNFNRLPPFFQAAWIGHADDPEIGFRIDHVAGENGAMIPQVTLVRNARDGFTLTVDAAGNSPASTDFDWSNLSVAAAGVLVRPSSLNGSNGSSPGAPRSPNGLGPNSILRSNPVLGTAVTVGGSALIYLAVDEHVSRMNIPPNLRGFMATAETLGIYEGLGRFGIIDRPQWGMVARSAPHLVLLNMGASHVFDAFGLPRGGRANSIATFATTTAAYTAAPRLAARFPQVASLYRASLGLPAAEGATIASFRGAGVLSGGLRFAGVVGAVFLVDWLGGSLGELAVWIGDGFGNPSPDTALWRAAKENLYADFANNAGGFTGWSARNLQFINKAAFGWASVFSSDFDNEMNSSVNDIIDRWVRGSNNFGDAMNNSMIIAALQSAERTPEGTVRINWETCQLLINAFYRDNGDTIAAGYTMDRLIRPTRRGGDIATSSEVVDLISQNGHISNRDDLESHLSTLFSDAQANGRLRTMLNDLIREERNAYRDRLGALNLLDGQTGRPTNTSELNDAQRAFLHGDGRTSEALTRRHRIEALNELRRTMDRLPAGSSSVWDEMET